MNSLSRNVETAQEDIAALKRTDTVLLLLLLLPQILSSFIQNVKAAMFTVDRPENQLTIFCQHFFVIQILCYTCNYNSRGFNFA